MKMCFAEFKDLHCSAFVVAFASVTLFFPHSWRRSRPRPFSVSVFSNCVAFWFVKSPMSYQTSSKRSPPFWLLIGARKTQVFWHQSKARTAATIWKWSGKTVSPGALLAVLYSFRAIYFPARLDFSSSPLSAPGSPRMRATRFWKETATAMTIGMPKYVSRRRQPPKGEVGVGTLPLNSFKLAKRRAKAKQF